MANRNDTRIYSIRSREILDSRGNPTIETTVYLHSGYYGTASVPSGASVGAYEAFELRDKDEYRYNGMGVLKAVNNVNTIIGPKLINLDSCDQNLIDDTMIKLDETNRKENLGANSILSVSLAISKAASNALLIPLYKYFFSLFSKSYSYSIIRMPTPIVNMINGGKHGAGNLDFQEFHVIPATNIRFSDSLRICVEIFHAIKDILIHRNAIHSIGDEGGYAPNLYKNTDALEILIEGIKTTKYRFGVEVFIGLDLAASYFLKDHAYHIKDKSSAFKPNEFIEYLKKIYKDTRLLLLEDALCEDDWSGWVKLTQELGQEVYIVGDDLLVTNKERLEKAIAMKACNTILLKPNQIGTLSEFLSVVKLAKENGFKTILSHRSGETNDSLIADLAVGLQTDYVKFGAPSRGERIEKYNRLLAIEEELFPK